MLNSARHVIHFVTYNSTGKRARTNFMHGGKDMYVSFPKTPISYMSTRPRTALFWKKRSRCLWSVPWTDFTDRKKSTQTYTVSLSVFLFIFKLTRFGGLDARNKRMWMNEWVNEFFCYCFFYVHMLCISNTPHLLVSCWFRSPFLLFRIWYGSLKIHPYESENVRVLEQYEAVLCTCMVFAVQCTSMRQKLLC